MDPGERRRADPLVSAAGGRLGERPAWLPSEMDVRALEAKGRALPPKRFRAGYGVAEVDSFLGHAIDALRGLLAENDALRTGVSPEGLWHARPRMTPLDVQEAIFRLTRLRAGYRMRPVDELFDEVSDALARLSAQNDALRARSESG